MKKLAVLMCLGMLAVGMTACGNDGDNANQSTEQTGATQTTQEAQGGETQDTTTEEEQTTEENTQGTSDYMDVSGGWSEEMTGIRQAVVDALGENYWPNTQIIPEMLESIYGVTPDMYDDYMGEMPMISTNVDTLLVVKAKEGQAEAVANALNAYRQMMIDDTMQYPMNVGKIQASRVETIGNYVCFVQLGADTSTAIESGDEAVIAQCQEQNDLAINALTNVLPQ